MAQKRHPSLQLRQDERGGYEILGRIGIRAECPSGAIEGEYDLTMIVPATYPERPPRVYDLKCQIPAAFEHVYVSTRELCLGAPVEVNRLFAQKRTLLHFLERQVEPFLLGASCAARFGVSGFPELAHGGRGLLDYYAKWFSCDDGAAVSLVGMLAGAGAPTDGDCPCGSGKPVGNCHGPRLELLRPHQTPSGFRKELPYIRDVAKKSMSFFALFVSVVVLSAIR